MERFSLCRMGLIILTDNTNRCNMGQPLYPQAYQFVPAKAKEGPVGHTPPSDFFFLFGYFVREFSYTSSRLVLTRGGEHFEIHRIYKHLRLRSTLGILLFFTIGFGNKHNDEFWIHELLQKVQWWSSDMWKFSVGEASVPQSRPVAGCLHQILTYRIHH